MNYTDLIVWRKAVDLVVEIYHRTESFPKSECFGLTQAKSDERRPQFPAISQKGKDARRLRTRCSFPCVAVDLT